MNASAVKTAREAKIHEILDVLFRERRAQLATNGAPGLLEANRLSIVYLEHQLARAKHDAAHGNTESS